MIPRFETSRLILRNVRLEDAPSYQKHFVDYEVIRNLSSVVPWPYPAQGVAYFIEHQILPEQGKDRWFWALTLKSNPEEIIGGIQLFRKGRPENRGFWLGRKFWNQGLMTEAVEPVIDYAFSDLGFEKLVFANAVGNIGSHRVKVKTGAKLIGREPAKFVDPNLTEHEIWELSKDEWISFKAQRP